MKKVKNVKEKINLKSIIAALIILVVGIFLALMDVFVWKSPSSIMLNIGCSFIASALVAIVTVLLVERQEVNPIEEWMLKTITSTRAEINSDCEIELEHAKNKVDIVAFGLRSFRTTHTDRQISAMLRKGVNFRILTMNPEADFVSAREKEENNKNIKDSINDLIEWADRLNSNNPKGKIIVKCYSSMTLDFYWRVDNVLYIGPYWYGYESQQTITYKYLKGGKGFRVYSDYFEKLWSDEKLTKSLTKATEDNKQRK